MSVEESICPSLYAQWWASASLISMNIGHGKVIGQDMVASIIHDMEPQRR